MIRRRGLINSHIEQSEERAAGIAPSIVVTSSTVHTVLGIPVTSTHSIYFIHFKTIFHLEL